MLPIILIQLDVKYVTPELSGLVHTTYLYATIDIYSRYKSGVILPSLDQALTIEALKYIIPKLPPVLFNNLDFIQTDNGLEYQHRFLTFLSQAKQEFSLPHHIKHHYIHKSSDMIWTSREAGLLGKETENYIADITRIQEDCNRCD